MTYSSRQLAKALRKIIADGKNGEKMIKNFFYFCRRKNLFYKLPYILKNLIKEEQAAIEQETVIMETIEKIDAETIKKIKKFIGAKEETALKFIFNNELKGGFRAVYKNVIYDGSIKNQLARLKEKMSQ